MGWLESAKTMFGDGGSLGCFPRIGRKSKNVYAYTVDPETTNSSSDKRKGSGGQAPEEVVVVDVPEVPLREVNELGRIAVQCLQYDPAFRPSMGTVARVINYAVVRDQQGVV
ncbi:hypothetical protein EJB05_38955 [Eragrostis curvula]|uniref:Serine-threonine/tyrosine-protein kinase catalytic domain-containing protein n=1 Tax=Eragrostis curvula TaxID=38414 RepID=A0A5J9TVQ7_9POAL|nr:hypothetical protein EJB05_38955 [Eragrostis curvula]